MKRFFKCFIAMCFCLFALASCNSGKVDPEAANAKYEEVFNTAVEEGKDVDGILEALISAKVLKYPLAVGTVREGYIMGYKNKKITLYTKVATAEPKSVSTTFAMHVFYAEDTAALLDELKANYDDGAWGCNSAQADRTQYYATKGNYVLAVIYPL